MKRNMKLKFCIVSLALAAFAQISFADYFLRGKWDGIEVNNYDFGDTVNVLGFVALGPDAEGYITLYAKPSAGDSQPIFRTRLTGVALQSYTAPAGEALNGMIASSDANYIHLFARVTNNDSGEIFRAEWAGIGVQTVLAGAGNVVHGFVIAGPDAEGYVYLGFIDGPMAVEETLRRKLPFSLDVYANPSNLFTIEYSVPGVEGEKARVSIRIYDLQGREVKVIADEVMGVGHYRDKWDCTNENGKSVSTGIYFVKCKAGKVEEIKKIVVIR